jgi:hypothetical protein
MDAEVRRLYDLMLRMCWVAVFTWAFPAWYAANYLQRKRVVLEFLHGPMSGWRSVRYTWTANLLLLFAFGWAAYRLFTGFLWVREHRGASSEYPYE